MHWYEKIPSRYVNIVSVVSGIITIGSAFFAFLNSFSQDYKNPFNITYIFIIIALFTFGVILLLRIRKYHQSSFERLKITSFGYHKLTHGCRNLYFDIMHSYKLDTLTIESLTTIYISGLKTVLDNLCNLMKDYTGQEISACIKLITYTDAEESIDINSQKLTTLCRSNNSDTDRDIYEQSCPIKLNENTDFMDIVDLSNGSRKNSFYQSNLLEFYQKEKRHYNNTNGRWQDFYVGTIVVPIQIEFKRLYHIKNNNAYHVIGFLCVDSLSPIAFTEAQEQFNTATVKSYADLLYILLSQYKHYLKKLSPNP